MANLPPVLVAPSILSADFARLGEQVRAVAQAGADWIHVDVMDGRFVPNLTIGPVVVEALARAMRAWPEALRRPLDCHLMIEAPDRYVPQFVEAGADVVTVHLEACPHLHRSLQLIHAEGARAGRRVLAGVSVNPHSSLEFLPHVLDLVDLVLVMSVNPGFGGQRFISAVLPKIAQARAAAVRAGRDLRVEVDGGVAPDTIARVREAGADVFVAGSAVFGKPDLAAAVRALREAAGA